MEPCWTDPSSAEELVLKALEVVATLKETAAEVLEQVGCWGWAAFFSTILADFGGIQACGRAHGLGASDFDDVEVPKMVETVADGQNHRFQ